MFAKRVSLILSSMAEGVATCICDRVAISTDIHAGIKATLQPYLL